jgi:hypothetical protein
MFTPLTAGTYTIKTWSTLPGDASAVNDTSASTLQVVDYSGITNAGQRLQFDGINDFINIPGASALSPGSAVTVEAWVSAGATGQIRTLVSKDSTATDRSYNLSLSASNNPQFTIQTANGPVSVTSSVVLTAGTWAHVAGTYDGTTINVYVNGELTGTGGQTGNITYNNSPLYIGKTGPSAAFFNGSLDEIKIWSVARTAAQIRQNMHTKYANFSQLDLVCNLHLDEGIGFNQTADASGNCNNGTLVSMDVQNTPLVTWVASTVPLGSPTVVELPVAASGPVTFTGADLTLDFTGFSGSDDYVVHYFNSVPPGTQPTGVTTVHPGTWIIYRYGTGSFTSVDATYQMQPGTLPALASDVKLYNRSNGSGGAWTLFQNAATSINNANSTAHFSYTSNGQFNQQFVIGLTNFPLSVKLISFEGEAKDKDAILKWETANEKDMNKYIVQRSVNGGFYETIGEVKAKGGQNGFNTYSFNDLNAASIGTTAYYRLTMIENNGRSSLSPIAAVQFGSKTDEVLKVQPNPFHNNLSISYAAKEAGNIQISILDLKGSVVYQQEVMVRQGINQLAIQPDGSLANGVYMLQVGNKNTMTTEKIIKN